jgi:hypothetical protein
MTALLARAVAAGFALALACMPALHAQAPAAPAAAAAPAPIGQEQLDSLLAPVALYPDQLLSQVLMAATYPLDVVEAARFVKANPELKGEALDNAIKDKSWDPSVQSLAAFPQVLDMMNNKLDWTQQLGEAFIDDQKRVLDTVQSLRAKAEAAGNLKSNAEQKVVVQEKTIIIEPAKPDVVYVPAYNPTVVYGTWWAPAYPPYFWYPPPIYGYPVYVPGAALAAGAIGFGIGLAVGSNHWGWCNTNWRGGDVNINVNRNNTFISNNQSFRTNVQNGNWQHNAAQRKGVGYKDAGARQKYGNVDNRAVAARQEFRGHDVDRGGDGARGGAGAGAGTRDLNNRAGAGAGGGQRDLSRPTGGGGGSRPDLGVSASPTSMNRGSPAFNSGASRQKVQMQSNRGAASRASMGGGGGRAGGGGGGRRR